MDKVQAIHNFWSSFGWVAIREASAYDEGAMERLGNPGRYITYEVATGSIGDSMSLSASLWHRSTSWEAVSKKAQEIANYIGYGSRTIKIDGGYMMLWLNNPFSQEFDDEKDQDHRRLVLSISAEFLTAT